MNPRTWVVPVVLLASVATGCGDGDDQEAICLPSGYYLDAAAEDTVAVAIYNNLHPGQRAPLRPPPHASLVDPNGRVVVENETDFGKVRSWLGEDDQLLVIPAIRTLSQYSRFDRRLAEVVPECDP